MKQIADIQRPPSKGLKAIFLDRDGVINRELEHGYVTRWEQFEFLSGVLDALALIKRAGIPAIIITNQSCINRGLVSKEEIERIHELMEAEIERRGGQISAIYLCPHRPDEGCECRKPRPCLLQDAMRDFALKPEEVLFIGDHDRDRGAAEAAGTRFEIVREGRGLLAIVRALIDCP
ncbi:MAG: HAD family hydrolase [Candidatus Thermoplasmatota archaeon]